MGLALLANIAAHDFGYIGIGQLIERTTNTLRVDGNTGTACRSFLQLVRYKNEGAVDALYLHSG